MCIIPLRTPCTWAAEYLPLPHWHDLVYFLLSGDTQIEKVLCHQILGYCSSVAPPWHFCTLTYIFLFYFSHFSFATFLFLVVTSPTLHYTVDFDVFPGICPLEFRFILFLFFTFSYFLFLSSACALAIHENRWLGLGNRWHELLTCYTLATWLLGLLTSLSHSCHFLGKKLATKGISLWKHNSPYLDTTTVLILEYLPLLLPDRIKGNPSHAIMNPTRKRFLPLFFFYILFKRSTQITYTQLYKSPCYTSLCYTSNHWTRMSGIPFGT